MPSSRHIHEFRRLSGLTWEEIASICEVTRRTVHFWASGEKMNADHAGRLQELLAFVRRIDRGEARRNRDLLLSLLPDGRRLRDPLRAGQITEALSLVGDGPGGGTRSAGHPLSRGAKERRRPPAPAKLAGSSTESVPKEGRLLREMSGAVRLRQGKPQSMEPVP